MIRKLEVGDIGVVVNYLLEEYEGIPAKDNIVVSLKHYIVNAEYKYIVEHSDGTIIGFYAYTEKTPNTALLGSVFLVDKYRKTRYLLELAKHVVRNLDKYRLVKCLRAHNEQTMPDKYYNESRKTFNIKKLAEKVK